jgi:hypothetical protein
MPRSLFVADAAGRTRADVIDTADHLHELARRIARLNHPDAAALAHITRQAAELLSDAAVGLSVIRLDRL